MALWDNQYPYTDFHELNLDYVLTIAEEMKTTLQQLQAALDRIETTESNVEQLQEDVSALQTSLSNLSTTLTNRIRDAENDISDLNILAASLRADLTTLQHTVNDTITPELDLLTGRVTASEGNITTLQGAVSTLQTTVSAIQYDVDQINSGFATAKYRDAQQDEINEVVYPYNHFDDRIDSVETSGSLSTINGWYRDTQIDSVTGDPVTAAASGTTHFAVSRLIPVFNAEHLYAKSGTEQQVGGSAQRFRSLGYYDSNGVMLRYYRNNTYVADPEPACAFIRIERTYTNVGYLYPNYTVAEDNAPGTTHVEYHEPYSGLRTAINEYVSGQGQLNNDILLDLVQIFKKVTGIGDSIMAGFMNRNGISAGSDVARTAGNNWIAYIGMRTGCTITNLAVGGASSHDWRVTYLNTANIDTDAYFVMLGTNDLRDSLTIGTSADINATDKTLNADTFYGNMDYIISSLRTFKPNAHIMVLTVPAVVQSGSGGYGIAVTPVNTALRYICGLYADHVHLIDLDAYATEFDRPIVSGNYSIGHFDPIAYNYMSAIIERAINRYMYDNQSKFPTAPYA